MKKQLMIAAALFVASVISYGAFAQQLDTQALKVLPTTQDGIVKVLVVDTKSSPIEVRFFDEDGLIETDNISTKDGLTSFSKKYDVRKLLRSKVRIEVSAADASVVYNLIKLDNGKYTPVLTRETHSYPVLAGN